LAIVKTIAPLVVTTTVHPTSAIPKLVPVIKTVGAARSRVTSSVVELSAVAFVLKLIGILTIEVVLPPIDPVFTSI
jgi:hypothetical protein